MFDEDLLHLQIGALLHDIGKPLGSEFLKNSVFKDFYEYVAYHHSREVNNSLNSLVHYVALADNFSSMERAEGGDHRETLSPLRNIFDLVMRKGNDHSTYIVPEPYITNEEGFVIPSFPVTSVENDKMENYLTTLEKTLRNELNHKGLLENPDYLSVILKKYLSTIPSETSVGYDKHPDVSLYDHLKTTAMIATCMYVYAKENKKELLTSTYSELKKYFESDEPAFLLVKGDLSGTQKFIYTITSKGALKSLRARSFFLELLQERVVQHILEELGLFRTNVHFIGGGHFYLVLPNTIKTAKALDKVKKELNQWLEKRHINLALIIESESFTAKAFKDMGSVFEKLGRKIEDAKLHPKLNRLKEIIGLQYSEGESCKICGARVKKLHSIGDEKGIACDFCSEMWNLGGELVKAKYLIEDENGYEIFDKKYKLVESLDLVPNLKGFKIKEIFDTSEDEANSPGIIPIPFAAYTAENGSADRLAEKAIGIKKLAIYRADLDNLGNVFSKGLKKGDQTLSRTSSLSERLTNFFKLYLPSFCAGILPKEVKFNPEQNEKRDVVIVYAGGDDIFIVGSWNDITELSIEIRRALEKYVGGNPAISISGGIVIAGPKIPIQKMAEIAENAESAAKKFRNSKNAISLFYAEEPGIKNKDVLGWEEVEQKIVPLVNMLVSYKSGKPQVSLDKSFLFKLFSLSENIEDPLSKPILAYMAARGDKTEKILVEEILKGNIRNSKVIRKTIQWVSMLLR